MKVENLSDIREDDLVLALQILRQFHRLQIRHVAVDNRREIAHVIPLGLDQLQQHVSAR